jgi:hypothetical protein
MAKKDDGYSKGNSDYAGISMVARARLAQAAADRHEGDPAVRPPHVPSSIRNAPVETMNVPVHAVHHEPLTAVHYHEHVSFNSGEPQGFDGTHLHEHEHRGDNSHDHPHPGH